MYIPVTFAAIAGCKLRSHKYPAARRRLNATELVERVRRRPRVANCEPACGEICARQLVTVGRKGILLFSLWNYGGDFASTKLRKQRRFSRADARASRTSLVCRLRCVFSRNAYICNIYKEWSIRPHYRWRISPSYDSKIERM